MPHDPNSYCTWWIDNDGSMECADIPSYWAISMADFVRWNSSVSSNCQGFEKGKSYCVEAFGEPDPGRETTTSTTFTISTTSTKAPVTNTTSTGGAPGLIQTGQVPNCNRWDLVKEGDTCFAFTTK